KGERPGCENDDTSSRAGVGNFRLPIFDFRIGTGTVCARLDIRMPILKLPDLPFLIENRQSKIENQTTEQPSCPLKLASTVSAASAAWFSARGLTTRTSSSSASTTWSRRTT